MGIVTHISKTSFGKHRLCKSTFRKPPSNMDSKNPGSNSPNGSNASNTDAEGYTLVQSRKQLRSQKKAQQSPRTSPKASSDDMFGDSPNGGSKAPAFFRTIADIHCLQEYPALPPSSSQLGVAGPSGTRSLRSTPSQPGVAGPSGTRSVQSSPTTKRHVIILSIF